MMNILGVTDPVDIVLVGGGHAHAVALSEGLSDPEAGHRVTLVVRDVMTPYSGMVPGVIAGIYAPDDAHIDLLRLARSTNCRIIEGTVTGLDPVARRVLIAGRAPLSYDLASINVGITPASAGIDGSDLATPVKPIATLLERITALEPRIATGDVAHVAVVGGGAAGVEIVFALRARFGPALALTLVSRGPVLSQHNRRVQAAIRSALETHDIHIVTGDVTAVRPGGLGLADGSMVTADAVLLNTYAAAPSWLSSTGLACDASGFLQVNKHLHTSDAAVFAAGDCVSFADAGLPKAGVYAVRQGPVLGRNLREAALARQEARRPALAPFKPQRRVLALLSTGDGRAVASRGPLKAEGRWVWRWKDAIDRAFMARLAQAGATSGARSPQVQKREFPMPEQVMPAWPHGVTARPRGTDLMVEATSWHAPLADDRALAARLAMRAALTPLIAAGASSGEVNAALAGDEWGDPQTIVEALLRAADEGFTVTPSVARGMGGPYLSLTARALVRPERALGLEGAKPGDLIVLSRPIGTGLALMAEAQGLLGGRHWLEVMATLDRSATGEADRLRSLGATTMQALGPNGLLAALRALARGSRGAAALTLSMVPGLADALTLAERLPLPRGNTSGDMAREPIFDGARGLSPLETHVLQAPECGTGLLATLPPEALDGLDDLPSGISPVGMMVDRLPGTEGALIVKA